MTDTSQEHGVSASEGDGLRPRLAELVALRRLAQRPPPPRRGRAGNAGQAPSPLRGRGMEYAESREYVAGDDARHIDWRVTARTGRAHTKLFQAERERVSLIVADTSPALYFGTRVRFKSVQAARAGAVAAWSAQRRGDRIGALRGSDREAPVAPAGGPRGVLRVLDALTRWYAQPPADDLGLERALDHAARVLRPGARLLVLADPQQAIRIAPARWGALAQHHDLSLVLLVDPLELQPPSAPLQFLAAQQRIGLDLRRGDVQAQWHAHFVEPLQELQRQLGARRIDVQVLSSDAASDAWLAPAPTEVPA
ncbi:DUF58 domain-containing protein [Stenotrophomonas maltophilia]|uniref:DUF58 domain-containing protein n=1 Tax=Stenotrophomonas maltophilia TaxID=40324 RepID=UPI002A9F4895|nr:DUF58 domain-containing protein [Stenotrophomonas maltophilia]MDZ5843132.1 DUF58 domain-containing protein [Stenotrophomonas maltophilia]HEL5052809.1 DUF58 domain-containing protein [Stenotrophomonas maltophilia]